MYTPSHFAEDRIDVMHGLICAHPLGTLVMASDIGLAADHVPFLLAPPTPEAPNGRLRAHVARANPLWRRAGAQALVVFQAGSAYISPSLYEEKRISGKVVPTWNYAAVHAHGTLHAIEDPAWLRALLAELTARHDSAWRIDDAPADYIDKLLKAIVGIEIPIERIEGKWKMSQNRSAADRARIAAQVPAAAALMCREGAVCPADGPGDRARASGAVSDTR